MKILIILLLSLLYNVTCEGQNKKEDTFEDLYIYVKSDRFIGDILAYKAYFSLASKDERFQGDNYYFKISFKSLDYKSLYSLGETINIDVVDYINPSIYFKDKTNCEIHTELSLYKRIFIITDIPFSKLENEKDKSKKHIIWYSKYYGTLKNIVHTNMTGKILLED